jgi:hypothetical protein
MVYTMWYLSIDSWYIPSKSGVYHEATFQNGASGRPLRSGYDAVFRAQLASARSGGRGRRGRVRASVELPYVTVPARQLEADHLRPAGLLSLPVTNPDAAPGRLHQPGLPRAPAGPLRSRLPAGSESGTSESTGASRPAAAAYGWSRLGSALSQGQGLFLKQRLPKIRGPRPPTDVKLLDGLSHRACLVSEPASSAGPL